VPAVQNALTIDVEEWFHICGVPALAPPSWPLLPSRVEKTTTLVLDELEAAGVQGTFFVLGWVAERYPGLVAAILARGHDIGSHSFWHRHVYELTEAEFVADLNASVHALTGAGARDVTGFRAPEWSINGRSLWALDALVGRGFTCDASMAPVRLVGDVAFPREPHVRATETGRIVETPPFVVDRLGAAFPMGWGWGLRMTSPRRLLREIEHANQGGRPVVLTIHPWELDPDPPRVSLPPRLRFAHYFRLDGFPERLRRVLRGAPFGPLRHITAGMPGD
jgi:polysaccharide deacetylase family protein (PEP-CTERM system associated)